MHEATIALAILRSAVAAAEKRLEEESNNSPTRTENSPPLFKVFKIAVLIGEFRNVDPESLDFTFSAIREDFPLARSATLEIRNVEALALCSLENHKYHPEPQHCYACTICGGGIEKLLFGNELDIVKIELEESLIETVSEEKQTTRGIGSAQHI